MVAMLSKPFRGKPNADRQDDLTQFKDTFQPDSGNFSPGYPLAPPQRVELSVLVEHDLYAAFL